MENCNTARKKKKKCSKALKTLSREHKVTVWNNFEIYEFPMQLVFILICIQIIWNSKLSVKE